MVFFPPAKINLGLNILHKRQDGFHDIDTVMMAVPLHDILEIVPSDTFAFSSSGIAIPSESGENLCVKAYDLLKNDFDLPPVHIHLHKIIPIGAGLGGGSSDAAFTLLGLNELCKLNLTRTKLEEYATQLGSDCAFFISSSPKHCTGRGEIMTDLPLTLSGKYLKLVYPHIHISTQEAYAGISPKSDSVSTFETTKLPIEKWKDKLSNDFEAPLFDKYPELRAIKQSLYDEGALYAGMSGSGSCLYGVFEWETEVSKEDYWEWVSVFPPQEMA